MKSYITRLIKRTTFIIIKLFEAEGITIFNVISVLSLVSAGIIFVHVGFSDYCPDDRVEEIMSSPGIIDQIKRIKKETAESQAARFVKEAKTFARHLDSQQKANTILAEQKVKYIRPQARQVSPKFKVVATSYYKANPEMSLALIDEPGKGRHWVKQSSLVGRFVIEQIENGFVTVKSNKGTLKFMLERGSETGTSKNVHLASTRALHPQNLSASGF